MFKGHLGPKFWRRVTQEWRNALPAAGRIEVGSSDHGAQSASAWPIVDQWGWLRTAQPMIFREMSILKKKNYFGLENPYPTGEPSIMARVDQLFAHPAESIGQPYRTMVPLQNPSAHGKFQRHDWQDLWSQSECQSQGIRGMTWSRVTPFLRHATELRDASKMACGL